MQNGKDHRLPFISSTWVFYMTMFWDFAFAALNWQTLTRKSLSSMFYTVVFWMNFDLRLESLFPDLHSSHEK